jgi:hypothetical protein
MCSMCVLEDGVFISLNVYTSTGMENPSSIYSFSCLLPQSHLQERLRVLGMGLGVLNGGRNRDHEIFFFTFMLNFCAF